MVTTVVIVEDEPEIREMLKFSLTRAGFEVKEARTSEMALQHLDSNLPDILVVDWMLPGMAGVELAKRLRRDALTENLPLLMLTARNEESGISAKFRIRYRRLRMSKTVLTKGTGRENQGAAASFRRTGRRFAGSVGHSHRLEQSPVTIEGVDISISPTEYRMLELFLRNPDRVFERDQLLDRVWGRSSYIETRTVDVHVETAKCSNRLGQNVQTVRSVGYRFTPTP